MYSAPNVTIPFHNQGWYSFSDGSNTILSNIELNIIFLISNSYMLSIEN